MGIDLFTLGAQIINFLLLVWLLNKFLYRPVLNAMAKREQKIAARLSEAAQKSAAAEAEKEKLLALQEQLKNSFPAEIKRAKEEADKFRDELLLAARREIASSRTQWLSSLDKEKESFLKETSLAVAKCFQQLATRALRDLAGEDLEKRILSVFLSELTTLSQDENSRIGRYITETGEAVVVTSAFDLSPAARFQLEKFLESLWGTALRGEFLLDASLLAGLKIEVAGKIIQWDVGAYLERFEKNLAASLERETFH
ncbi:MAG: F0F1 ATP synthase subunit delta [Deltaproteobacteria bacterium]|nr:F0F1 ATP synthase subunit delta [Deltaproteobacteria bacterium]